MQTPHTFDELRMQLRTRFVPFMLVFFAAVFFTYLVLFIVDIYPEPKTEVVNAQAEVSAEAEIVEETEYIAPITTPAPVAVVAPVAKVDPLPVEIIFDDLNNRTVSVANPQDNSIAALDNALLNGAVRHPDSADFADEGNIFILAHSSYLPNVLNKNFQAFNGIQDLTWGDTIRLRSADTEYIYRVDRVYKAKATEVVVPTDGVKPKLTLATCNSFGSKDDRHMVEATLIEAKVL